MADVKITREHRLEAIKLTGWDVDRPECVALTWLDVGGDTHTVGASGDGGYILNLVEESAVAKALAETEHRVRAAVIADLRGLVERAHSVDNAGVEGLDIVYADSIRNLIDSLESQQS